MPMNPAPPVTRTRRGMELIDDGPAVVAPATPRSAAGGRIGRGRRCPAVLRAASHPNRGPVADVVGYLPRAGGAGGDRRLQFYRGAGLAIPVAAGHRTLQNRDVAGHHVRELGSQPRPAWPEWRRRVRFAGPHPTQNSGRRGRRRCGLEPLAGRGQPGADRGADQRRADRDVLGALPTPDRDLARELALATRPAPTAPRRHRGAGLREPAHAAGDGHAGGADRDRPSVFRAVRRYRPADFVGAGVVRVEYSNAVVRGPGPGPGRPGDDPALVDSRADADWMAGARRPGYQPRRPPGRPAGVGATGGGGLGVPPVPPPRPRRRAAG